MLRRDLSRHLERPALPYKSTAAFYGGESCEFHHRSGKLPFWVYNLASGIEHSVAKDYWFQHLLIVV